MGCHKITYHQAGEGIDKSPLKILDAPEEKIPALIFCNNYTPFGLQHASSYQRSYSTKQAYKYQGKEELPEIGVGMYDFHARMYDATLGRTFQLDPMADNFEAYSPYSWVLNNPLTMIDPTGMVTLRGDFARMAFESIRSMYGGGGSSSADNNNSGGCGENGQPCPDDVDAGQQEANDLLPDGVNPYMEVVPGPMNETFSGAQNGGLTRFCETCPKPYNSHEFQQYKDDNGDSYTFLAGNWVKDGGTKGDYRVVNGTSYEYRFGRWNPMYTGLDYAKTAIRDYAISSGIMGGVMWVVTGSSGIGAIGFFGGLGISIGVGGMSDAEAFFNRYYSPAEIKILKQEAESLTRKLRRAAGGLDE